MFSPLEQFEVVRLYGLMWNIFDVSVTNFTLPLILLLLFVSFFLVIGESEWFFIPNTWQLCWIFIYQFVWQLVKQQIGEKGIFYYPFIFCIFTYILCLNLWSLFPFGIAITSHFIIVLYLSMVVWGSIFFIGLIQHNLVFLKIFIPNCPFLLLILLIPIEIFSYVIRMFSLAIRLVANILAGHTLVILLQIF